MNHPAPPAVLWEGSRMSALVDLTRMLDGHADVAARTAAAVWNSGDALTEIAGYDQLTPDAAAMLAAELPALLEALTRARNETISLAAFLRRLEDLVWAMTPAPTEHGA